MTADEAKGLFALMGWKWEHLPLGKGNNVRGRLPPDLQGRYEVFVNEVMEYHVRGRTHEEPVSQYESYDVDKCLTRYAELYTEYIANKKD